MERTWKGKTTDQYSLWGDRVVAEEAGIQVCACVCVCVNLKIKDQLVNGDGVFASVVLHGPGQEGLGEEETRQPEHVRLAVVVPILEKEKTGNETTGRLKDPSSWPTIST